MISLPFYRFDHKARPGPWDNEASIREELFSIDRLEQHAASLAAAQRVIAYRSKGRSLVSRLKQNQSTLLDAYRSIAAAAGAGSTITPAAEWLLDNYHLVEQQIQEVLEDLPDGYYLQLPKLLDGPFAGYPRILGVAWAFVAHTDSRYEPQMLHRFLLAYQRVQPLTIGELWAVAITLRIVLVENLRRAACRIVTSRAARDQADLLADQLLSTGRDSPESLAALLHPHDRLTLDQAFAVRLVQRLRDQDPSVMPAMAWLEKRLAAKSLTVDEIVHEEHQRQGATNVTVRNIITSARFIADTDWTEFFEGVSPVDVVLRTDAGFAEMDFPTRNLYRSAIEQLARGTTMDELAVTHAAMSAAARRKGREAELGYHLLAAGRPALEHTLRFRPSIGLRLESINRALGVGGYVGLVMLVAAAILLGVLLMLSAWAPSAWVLGLLAVLGLIPAIDAAMALTNRAISRGFSANILPGLELRHGIPAHLRTLVAVPTLLTTETALAEQLEQLEIHHLASPDSEVYFALLTDWQDAPSASLPTDAALFDAAIAGIAALNRRYAPAQAGPRFLLLHRRRTWNASQQCWMGWERKRGKLHELNRALRGANDTNFLDLGSRVPAPPDEVRYVITLDADTRLPRETVRRLVGKMAHPLNRPCFDADARRVVEGYGVLQPRVTPSLPIGSEGSLYQRLFSSPSGIDPYSAAVSDVYQDLWGEGTYTGKGIYDVDAFEAALAGRVPDNTMLSHDLFEGTFVRAGLASDVEVVEEFPSRYDVATARQHRWARGDWQLLPWLFGRRARFAGNTGANTIPAVGRWKMVDNLRRSLSAPSSVAALVVGWALPLNAALAWTAFIVGTIGVSTLLPLLSAIVPRRTRVTALSHMRALATDARLAVSLAAMQIVFLADQAASMVDAIVRTLYRLLISKRRLLDWVTAAQTRVGTPLGVARAYAEMRGGVALSLAAVVFVAIAGQDAWLVAAPFVIAWLLAPALARWASVSPRDAGRLAISPADTRALRMVGRRTWRYFETFVTPVHHHLPPDNFQEDPKPVVADRTSPTNIGLYLLSVVSARDFGWIGTLDMVERLELTLTTMGEMQRFRGHFYNWYGTRDLRPLDPQYISSVDSGNLAGHLIAMASACAETAAYRAANPASYAGIADAANLVRTTLETLPAGGRIQSIVPSQLEAALRAVTEAVRDRAPDAHDVAQARLTLLADDAATLADITRTLAHERGDHESAELQFWSEAALRSIRSHLRDLLMTPDAAAALASRLSALQATARGFVDDMDFGFLLNPERRLLAIGYRVQEGCLDTSCYDLLASEARLASLVAIAKGEVQTRHWFRLGRAVRPVEHGAALVSWSGSMFEYLMPSLVMRAPAGSLLEQTNRLVVARQIHYAKSLGIPWGISESAYNVRNLELTYQYTNFGVPGLGLKRGLGENLVIAPYATALASMVDPEASMRNFERLESIGARGRYGFYEAVDFTPARIPEGSTRSIVRAFMAHHQGMTIVAICNTLLDGVMRARFHAEPLIQATELLLQERTPRDVAITRAPVEPSRRPVSEGESDLPSVRRILSPHTDSPQTHLLSNGDYCVMLTSAGSGYSRWGDIAITRWRPDSTRDDMGSYIFLRDMVSGAIWSAGYQPSAVEPHAYEVSFTEDRAEFVRHDDKLTTTLVVAVSPEDHAEVRRVSLANTGAKARDVELTSYAELVLAPTAADLAHPAFSKLFVQTEYLPRLGAIIATRRPRSADDPQVWAAHLAVVEGETIGVPEIETDRASFLGRGREIRAPLAVIEGWPLTNTAGTVLDPVFAMRRRVRIAPYETCHIAFWTIVAPTRDALLDLIDKHHDTAAFERTLTLAWIQAQVQLSHFGINADQANLFQRIAGYVLYPAREARPGTEVIARGAGSPDALWACGISGDLPIIVLRVEHADDLGIVHQLLRGHEYWRMKQLAVDLVILNERASSYVQDLQASIEALIRTTQSGAPSGMNFARGSVFALRRDLIAPQSHARLLSVACLALHGGTGTLAEQISAIRQRAASPPPPPPPHGALARSGTAAESELPSLEFFNGLGGFACDGREYVTILEADRSTPAPWINVIANPAFGFHVSAEGSGYTWSSSSREHQLTPWSNDPVTDRPGEVLYVRDEQSGALFGPTALPMRNPTGRYIAIHGQGYSRFQHTEQDIELDLLQFVPLDATIKISRLTLRNRSTRARRLNVTAYVEWVLGPSRTATAHSLITHIDTVTGAMFACNPADPVYGARMAFADLGGRQQSWTGDRREFIGRHGTLDNPAGLSAGTRLSKRVGAGLDACSALQAPVTLEPGGSTALVFLLGDAASSADAQAAIQRYRTVDIDTALARVVEHWDEVLGTVQVRTPDRAMDIALNRWLLYQTLVCRVWARAAFYQASGAYGFRDQIQDGMALAIAQPQLTREHLLRAAGRQFLEGDVQHWWLPATGAGVRTRISDDRVWLAYAVAQYIETTADTQVLDETIAFLSGPVLRDDEHEAFFTPTTTDQGASLFEHCARALDGSLANGVHGLPLIGTGDWNDGMNRVGAQGKGESVWLGWFRLAALNVFAPIALARHDTARVQRWRDHAEALRTALERDGWDGDWYKRGYFDDGTPLGSSTSDECRIDSIAQSWSVLTGAGDPARSQRAMAAVARQLVREDASLIVLFTPPFERTRLDPGYIKGYPPGIRENGGQYTHAAAWVVMAVAAQGDGDKAAELFSMLNPINRSDTRAGVRRYKVEPYVTAADIYSVEPHIGRGGWTWYTGSAAWLYRAGLESLLGFQLRGDALHLAPCIPRSWPGFSIVYKYRTARYDIVVENVHAAANAVTSVEIDGTLLHERGTVIPLRDDGRVHAVRIRIGTESTAVDPEPLTEVQP